MMSMAKSYMATLVVEIEYTIMPLENATGSPGSLAANGKPSACEAAEGDNWNHANRHYV